ncbi:MAG: hypothetical protein Fur0023_18160 [Bacteroidia bacterium]
MNSVSVIVKDTISNENIDFGKIKVNNKKLKFYSNNKFYGSKLHKTELDNDCEIEDTTSRYLFYFEPEKSYKILFNKLLFSYHSTLPKNVAFSNIPDVITIDDTISIDIPDSINIDEINITLHDIMSVGNNNSQIKSIKMIYNYNDIPFNPVSNNNKQIVITFNSFSSTLLSGVQEKKVMFNIEFIKKDKFTINNYRFQLKNKKKFSKIITIGNAS